MCPCPCNDCSMLCILSKTAIPLVWANNGPNRAIQYRIVTLKRWRKAAVQRSGKDRTDIQDDCMKFPPIGTATQTRPRRKALHIAHMTHTHHTQEPSHVLRCLTTLGLLTGRQVAPGWGRGAHRNGPFLSQSSEPPCQQPTRKRRRSHPETHFFGCKIPELTLRLSVKRDTKRH